MGLLKRLFGATDSDPAPERPTGQAASFTQVGYVAFDEQRADAELDIVGEQSYQRFIAEAIRSRRDVGPRVPFSAVLMPEPTNAYDRNAIAVALLFGDGQTAAVVGYLSREDAIEYRPVFARIAPRVIRTTAMLKGGMPRSPDEPSMYGVVLHLGSPSELLAELFRSTFSAPPPHRWTGKLVCFTGPSRHSVHGVQLGRHGLEYLAWKAGCTTWPRITKKVDVCIASSVDDETGKLSKAEEYGIEVVREEDFWPGIGLRLERLVR